MSKHSSKRLSQRDAEYAIDYEGPTEQLEEDGTADPVDFWEKKQRELLTSVVDYNLGTLAELIEQKRIDLSPRYQRRFRWDAKRQSKLIESFLMNVPVPPIFLNEDQYGQYSVIDGKQRLMAIYELFRGRLRLKNLEVFSDINDKSYDELPPPLQTVMRVRPTLRAIIILRQSDPDIKFEVFQRLNTGGVKLNAQEIRNSTFPGPLNDLILDLSESKRFHDLLGISHKSKSGIYREMRDAEFVLRFFTFRKDWSEFNGRMRRQLDRFMSDHQRPGEAFLVQAKDDFTTALDAVSAAFGEHAFRRWQPEKNSWRKQVLASLFDAEMFACFGLSAERLAPLQDKVIRELQKLFSDTRFREAIDAATNTPELFRRRIEMMQSMIRGVLKAKGNA